METAMFDLREVRRAFVLAAWGTAIVVVLFARFIGSQPVSEAEASVMKARLAHMADGR
jgi:hypothetical protein